MGDGDLQFTPKDPGAYRAEVRMRPDHLRQDIGTFVESIARDHPWIYANPIYVTP